MTILPADLAQRLSGILEAFGETVNYASPDGSVTWVAKASPQSPAAAGLINDLDQDSLILFFSAVDVPVAPTQMGTILVRGVRRTVREVVLDAPNGIPTTYMVRVSG